MKVAPDVARRRLRARLLMWAAALVTVASLFTLVAFHVFAAQSAFTLERLSKERTNEQLRYQRLRNDVSARSSAQAVIEASNKLGMVQGPTPKILTVAAPGPKGNATNDTIPAASSSREYDQLKHALGPTP
ncbi:MAG TPA: hypothetical protein VGP92_16400 [Acidimicrobiia bacterium]|nr:hypothetical protein [Acidimicrobiia bacterium]